MNIRIKIIVSTMLAFSVLLSSCVGVALVGAAGGMVVYDRRSIVMMEKDSRNFYVINRAVANDQRFWGSRVSIRSYNEVVLLTGQVTSASLKPIATRYAQSAPNVHRVYDELTVGEPIDFKQRSHDTLITGQVRSKLLTEKGLESGSIHIETENSNVYLMGIVTHEQADRAVNVTRQVPGVNKVVKIFQYIV